MAHPTDNLPIFPLSLVLVPRMVIPLRIFEDRYKQMIRDCAEEKSEFGISLIRSGEEVGGSAQPYEIGTIASIRDQRPLPNDEILLIAVGTRRYRILRITQDQPYLRAATAPVRDASDRQLSSSDPQCKRLSERAAELFALLAGADEKPDPLPEDPEMLGWALVARLPVENERRQNLLEMTSVEERLQHLDRLVEQLVPQARQRAKLMEQVRRIRQTNGKLSHLSEE
jgi:Lon protease-like protein